MQELTKMNNEMVTMTSLEVVELINNFRKEEGNETKKEHKTFMRDIRNELKTLENVGITNQYNFVPVKYTDIKGEERPCYKMNKAGIMQMLNKESALVRYKTQQYIEALENKLNKPTCIEDLIIMQAQSIKDMREQVNQANKNALKANQLAIEAQEKVQSIKDVVSLDTSKWRSDTQRMIAKIAKVQKDFKHIGQIRNESYELLNKRFGVSLETRLINKKRRMALEGVSKAKIDKLNNLDVIEDDKKLKEGYVAIVKDMAIKYGV